MAVNKAVAVIDAWAEVAAASVRNGTSIDLSLIYGSAVLVQVGLTTAAAQDGIELLVETSTDETNWTEYGRYSGTAGTPSAAVLDGGEPQGEISIEVDTTAGFTEIGQKWLIVDGTVANSEVVTVIEDAAATTFTIMDGLKNTHATALSMWSIVDEWVFTFDMSLKFVRISPINHDADSAIHHTTRSVEVDSVVA